MGWGGGGVKYHYITYLIASVSADILCWGSHAGGSREVIRSGSGGPARRAGLLRLLGLLAVTRRWTGAAGGHAVSAGLVRSHWLLW